MHIEDKKPSYEEKFNNDERDQGKKTYFNIEIDEKYFTDTIAQNNICRWQKDTRDPLHGRRRSSSQRKYDIINIYFIKDKS